MNNLKRIILLTLIIPISVKANCSNQELTRYKSLASNINNYYDYDETSNKFNITAYNLSNELRIINKSDESSYETNDQFGEINIGNLNPGNTVTLGVYPKNDNCKDYRVYTIYVNLPYYNQYYNDEVCINNNNQLCSKWVNTSKFSHEEFINRVKQEKSGQQEEIKEPEEEMKKYGFFDFIADFYIPILLVIIVGGSVAIYFLDKKRKFDF